MSFVGTPTYLGNDVLTLASIIQGESPNAAGQQAVANVIQNRASQNFSGFGTNLISQALAKKQFQGQDYSPSANAISLAQQAIDGTLPNVVPNSLNYAAPGSTASWAVAALGSGDGVKIGGNTFFVNSNGGTPTYDPNAASTTPGSAPDYTAANGGSMSMLPGPVGSILNGATPGSGTGSAASALTSSATTPGVPVNVTDVSSAGVTGLNTLSKSVNNAGGDITKSEANLAGSGTSWFNYIGSVVLSFLTRGMAGLLAILLIGLGIWFMRPSESAA